MTRTPQKYEIISLYQFIQPHWTWFDVDVWLDKLKTLLDDYSALGHVLLAPEGVNGTVCAPVCCNEDTNSACRGEAGPYQARTHPKASSPIRPPLHQALQELFPGATSRQSFADQPAFQRLRIRRKDSLIRMQEASDVPVTPTSVGTYVAPSEWNRLLRDESCLVIDTRNNYEVQLGSFRGATAPPHMQSFTEFPSWMQEQLAHGENSTKRTTKIAMFCTGGIRCERSTSWLKQYMQEQGRDDVPEVYHLQGGILNYLATVKLQESLYEGECYVFDKRVAVGHGLEPSQQYTACFACRHVLNQHDREHAHYEEGISCVYCYDSKQSCRRRYQDRQDQLLREGTSGQRARRAS